MTDSDLAAAGIPPDKKARFEEMRRYKIWKDHEAVFKLYLNMRTQWRTAMGGVVGLDYTPLFHELDRMSLSKVDYDEYFRLLQIMESVDLGEIASRAKRKTR